MNQFMQLAYAVARISLWIIDYYCIFGNRPLHMQFLERSKDILNVRPNVRFTLSSAQTAILFQNIMLFFAVAY